MKNLLLFLLCLACAPRLATAQDAQNAVGGERVTYSRAIPKGLRAVVPRGGKSRFWGATNLKYNGQQVWVHVYNVRRANFSRDVGLSDLKDYAPSNREFQAQGINLGVQKSGVDLFVFASSHKLRRIDSARFSYVCSGADQIHADPETVGIETLWLDSPSRKSPIVKVRLEDPNGFRGAIGLDMLIVFPKGLGKGAVVEGFGYGSDSNDGWEADMSSRDEKGLLQIKTTYSTMEGNLNDVFRWNGKYFVSIFPAPKAPAP